MQPSGLATHHEAGNLLAEWAMYGCPAMTGQNWTAEQMEAAILQGPHKSALEPDAILHFAQEMDEKSAGA